MKKAKVNFDDVIKALEIDTFYPNEEVKIIDHATGLDITEEIREKLKGSNCYRELNFINMSPKELKLYDNEIH